MVKVLDVGSTTIISFQTKYPTFSAIEFDKKLTDLQYQSKIVYNALGSDPPQSKEYSKEDIVINFNNVSNVLTFILFNTINLTDVYKEITNIIASLKIDHDAIQLMGLNCTTRAHDVGNPESKLSSLLKSEVVNDLSKTIGYEPGIGSLVLVNKNPVDEDVQVRIEPLASNPKESFHIVIAYKTNKPEKFNEYITQFGIKKIEEICAIGEIWNVRVH